MDKAKLKLKTAVNTSTRVSQEKQDMPPEGAEIVEQDIRTETEEIENGWLVTKHYSGRYKKKDSKDDYPSYFSYCKKWYSETNPITVTVTDKSLAEAFEME